MPKFSVKQLMWCTAFVAAGVASLMIPFRWRPNSQQEYAVALLLFYMSGPLIGVGLSWLWPFRPRWVGMAFGGFLGFISFMLIAFFLSAPLQRH